MALIDKIQQVESNTDQDQILQAQELLDQMKTAQNREKVWDISSTEIGENPELKTNLLNMAATIVNSCKTWSADSYNAFKQKLEKLQRNQTKQLWPDERSLLAICCLVDKLSGGSGKFEDAKGRLQQLEDGIIDGTALTISTYEIDTTTWTIVEKWDVTPPTFETINWPNGSIELDKTGLISTDITASVADNKLILSSPTVKDYKAELDLTTLAAGNDIKAAAFTADKKVYDISYTAEDLLPVWKVDGKVDKISFKATPKVEVVATTVENTDTAITELNDTILQSLKSKITVSAPTFESSYRWQKLRFINDPKWTTIGETKNWAITINIATLKSNLETPAKKFDPAITIDQFMQLVMANEVSNLTNTSEALSWSAELGKEQELWLTSSTKTLLRDALENYDPSKTQDNGVDGYGKSYALMIQAYNDVMKPATPVTAKNSNTNAVDALATGITSDNVKALRTKFMELVKNDTEIVSRRGTSRSVEAGNNGTVELQWWSYTIDSKALPKGFTSTVTKIENTQKDPHTHDATITVWDQTRSCCIGDQLEPRKVTIWPDAYNITPVMDVVKHTISFTAEKVEAKAAEKLLETWETTLERQMNNFSQKLFDHMDPKDTETINALRPIGERATNTMRTRMSAIMEKYNTVNPTDLIAKLQNNTLQKTDFVNSDNSLTDTGKALHETMVTVFDTLTTMIQEANQVLIKKDPTKYKPIIDAGTTVNTSLTNLLSYTRSENGFVDVLTAFEKNPNALDQFLNKQATSFEQGMQDSPLYSNTVWSIESMSATYGIETTLNTGQLAAIWPALDKFLAASSLITIKGEVLYCNTQQLSKCWLTVRVEKDGRWTVITEKGEPADQLLLDAKESGKVQTLSVSAMVNSLYDNTNFTLFDDANRWDMRDSEDSAQSSWIQSLANDTPYGIQMYDSPKKTMDARRTMRSKEWFIPEEKITTELPSNNPNDAITLKNTIDEHPLTLTKHGISTPHDFDASKPFDTKKQLPFYKVQNGWKSYYISNTDLYNIFLAWRASGNERLWRREVKKVAKKNTVERDNLTIDYPQLALQKYGISGLQKEWSFTWWEGKTLSCTNNTWAGSFVIDMKNSDKPKIILSSVDTWTIAIDADLSTAWKYIKNAATLTQHYNNMLQTREKNKKNPKDAQNHVQQTNQILFLWNYASPLVTGKVWSGVSSSKENWFGVDIDFTKTSITIDNFTYNTQSHLLEKKTQ